MSPAEMGWRLREQVLRRAWTRSQVRAGRLPAGAVPGVLPGRRFTAVLRPGARDLVPEPARAAIVAAADRILKGEWDTLGVVRTDMAAPDWFRDPVSGRRSDPTRYAFGIDHRSEEQVGNIKQVWEVNRLQHLTLLAIAWYLTGYETYAQRVADQLRSWWSENPFLSGVNWTSGIELGIRLMNFVWIRRLLDSWPGATGLFEDNDLALRQIRWHQEYLAAFVSRGSSANNHVIAEAAGQLAASCTFPWFAESARWRERSAALLERSLSSNTFPSGINRELASDYHGFVFELGVFAAAEASASGTPVSDDTWQLLRSMADGMAALVDAHCRPPRQGDSDEGRVVLLDDPASNRWPTLLALGGALFGCPNWWPPVTEDAGSTLVAGLVGAGLAGGLKGDRPSRRPSRFEDAGITILRTHGGDFPEIWCRCDGGPHGFLSIGAHAHADALSVEVRYDGVDVLADPGTYCYHGEPEWREYFRSTIAHNTLEVAGRSQSTVGGPFMWLRHANTRQIPVGDPATAWAGEHDGYESAGAGIRHQRIVRLAEAARCLEITDELAGKVSQVETSGVSGQDGPVADGGHEVRLAFHLGPDVSASLAGAAAELAWPGASAPGTARMELPVGLRWTLHQGETTPASGWYSEGFGRKVPAITLIGTGQCRGGTPLVTRLKFYDKDPKAEA